MNATFDNRDVSKHCGIQESSFNNTLRLENQNPKQILLSKLVRLLSKIVYSILYCLFIRVNRLVEGF